MTSLKGIAIMLIALLPTSICTAQDTLPDAMGFEAPGLWMTAPPLLDDYPEEHLWSTRTIPFADLAGGVKLSEERVKQGQFSGRWADHPRYSTIHTSHVPTDWSASTGVTFWAYSEDATGEIITLAVEADDPDTPWKDYYRRDFAVDWTGWQQVAVAIDDFAPYESPVGWDSVDAVYLFTKIDDRQPNPHTVLHLDDMRLEADPITSTPAPVSVDPPPGRLPVSGQIPAFDASAINHAWPELRDGTRGEAPIQYESYFLTERSLFGYYPRFAPGAVSFGPDGETFVQYGSHVIQNANGDGTWSVNDLLYSVIEPYAREQLGFTELQIGNSGQTNETSIRFDADGDAYKLCFVSDPTGDWKTRKGLLLHSRDGMQTWDVYLLPNYMLRFEKFVGHNPDCMKRPPVILLSTYHSPTEVFITIPEKQADGTLVIPKPVQIAD
ncbi:MAG TPA: carbohydrate binding domain-containing protein, partial [Armatimonadota bacterium]|nr:carbohydrate binding domain-containing protein [Armatimonadota bacterium]